MEIDGDNAQLTTVLYDSGKWLWFLTKRDTFRQVESWERIDGTWMLMSEQTLERKGSLSV
jgi:hypothetical protein